MGIIDEQMDWEDMASPGYRFDQSNKHKLKKATSRFSRTNNELDQNPGDNFKEIRYIIERIQSGKEKQRKKPKADRSREVAIVVPGFVTGFHGSDYNKILIEEDNKNSRQGEHALTPNAQIIRHQQQQYLKEQRGNKKVETEWYDALEDELDRMEFDDNVKQTRLRDQEKAMLARAQSVESPLKSNRSEKDKDDQSDKEVEVLEEE